MLRPVFCFLGALLGLASFRQAGQKPAYDVPHMFDMVLQGRHLDLQHVQTVVEVRPGPPFVDEGRERAVRLPVPPRVPQERSDDLAFGDRADHLGRAACHNRPGRHVPRDHRPRRHKCILANSDAW